jgi:hypothetical protein
MRGRRSPCGCLSSAKASRGSIPIRSAAPTERVPEQSRAVQRTYRSPVRDLRMQLCQRGGPAFGTKGTAPQSDQRGAPHKRTAEETAPGFQTARTVERQAIGGSQR